LFIFSPDFTGERILKAILTKSPEEDSLLSQMIYDGRSVLRDAKLLGSGLAGFAYQTPIRVPFKVADAAQPEINALAVVKIFKDDPVADKLFHQEQQMYRILKEANLDSANFPTLLDVFELERHALLIAPFGERLLDAWMDDVVKAWPDLLVQLRKLHDLKIVHRDIRPENIIYVSASSSLVLIDWGAATKIQHSLFCGTIHFASTSVLEMLGTSAEDGYIPSVKDDLESFSKVHWITSNQEELYLLDSLTKPEQIKTFWMAHEQDIPLLQHARESNYDQMLEILRNEGRLMT